MGVGGDRKSTEPALTPRAYGHILFGMTPIRIPPTQSLAPPRERQRPSLPAPPPRPFHQSHWRDSAKPSRVTVPERAHPFAKLVFGEMGKQGVTYVELEHRSGVLTSTTKAWRGENTPSLASIEATLGALGYTLVPVPRLETLPDHVREALEDVGQNFTSSEQTFGAAIAAAAAWPEYSKISLARTLKLAHAA